MACSNIKTGYIPPCTIENEVYAVKIIMPEGKLVDSNGNTWFIQEMYKAIGSPMIRIYCYANEIVETTFYIHEDAFENITENK